MKKFIIASIVMFTAACASHRTAALATVPTDAPTATSTIVSAATPAPAIANQYQPGEEISADPIVTLVNNLTQPADVDAALQIGSQWGDKLGPPCVNWIAMPTTKTRLADLLNFKSTLQTAFPESLVKPVGPLSFIALGREIDHDMSTGTFNARLAQAINGKRVALYAFKTDFALACGPVLLDMQNAPARIAAAVAAAVAAAKRVVPVLP